MTRLALDCGFRGIDTANQRKHYHEAQEGEAIAGVLEKGQLNRGELFVQTKFTHRPGQDHRLPYDEEAPVGEQVRQQDLECGELSLSAGEVEKFENLEVPGGGLSRIIYDSPTAAHQSPDACISLRDDALHRLWGSILASEL